MYSLDRGERVRRRRRRRRDRIVLTDAQDVEHETVLRRLVGQLVGHAVEADVSVQIESAHGRLVVLVELKTEKHPHG